MRELHSGIIVNFPQAFIKALSFIWFSIFLFIFRVREYVLWSQKRPSEEKEKVTRKKGTHVLNIFFSKEK